MIVAVAGAGVDAVELGASADDGTARAVRHGGCPSLPSTLICSYTVGVFPEDEAMTVSVTLHGGEAKAVTLDLREYNYCAQDIAYLRIDVDGDEPRILEARYVSPCSLFGGES